MDSGDSPTIALFSIHPVYAKAILDGSKKVEFRKTGIFSEFTQLSFTKLLQFNK